MKNAKVAILLRGDREATPRNNRFHRVFAALGIQTEPAVYADDIVDEVRGQLLPRSATA